MNLRGFALAMLVAFSWAAPAAAQPAIPAEVGCYVDAVNGKDLERLLGCFTDDAVVIDVSRRIEGLDAIRRWADAELIGGKVEVISVEPQEGGRYRCLVVWAPGGSGGWRAWYSFTVDGGRITGMDLQYA